MTEYFTQYENLADTANDLSKVLSNAQSTCLSRKLKMSVQGKVTDSQLFYFSLRLRWMILRFVYDELVTVTTKTLNNTSWTL